MPSNRSEISHHKKRRKGDVLAELEENDVVANNNRKQSERALKKGKVQSDDTNVDDFHSDDDSNEVENKKNVINGRKVDLHSGSSYTKELSALRKKYDALCEFRETETERLLHDAKALASEEKRMYEKVISKLKHELEMFSRQAEDSEKKHKKQLDALQAQHEAQIKVLQSKAQEDLAQLQKVVNDKEALVQAERLKVQQLSSLKSKDIASNSASVIESAELSQARKLLDIYRIVTSTEIRLLLSPDDHAVDGGEEAVGTDVEIVVADSASGRRFQFDMAIPDCVEDELEYVPSDQPNTDCIVPSYLQDELTFQRKELSKFMRALLDVVIRNKKSREAPVSAPTSACSENSTNATTSAR